jgi:hypothetical protein
LWVLQLKEEPKDVQGIHAEIGRMKLPAIQFYPADWRKDPGVQSLDYFDKGVWFEILCLMHESPERGKLLLNGVAMPDAALARVLGLDNQTLTKTLTTLLDYGVASRDLESGALINRRMVKDETVRKIRTEAGRKGGNPVLLNQKPTTKDKQKTTTGVKQKPTPSSSTSVSTSSTDKKETSAHAEFFRFLELKIGPIPNGGKQGKAIKWLIDHGYEFEQCKRCYESLATEDWRTNAVDWVTVQSQIGAWLVNHPTPVVRQRPSQPARPLPPGVANWVCGCGFGVLQNGNGIKTCPQCQGELKAESQVA